MSEIPFVDDVEEAAEEAKNKARNLVPWLPDPMTCPECNVLCVASRVYDPQTAAFHPMGLVPCWECPECGECFRREEPWFE